MLYHGLLVITSIVGLGTARWLMTSIDPHLIAALPRRLVGYTTTSTSPTHDVRGLT